MEQKETYIPQSIDDVVLFLKTKRKEDALSCEDAAQSAGLHHISIQSIPRAQSIANYAAALGVNTSFLVDANGLHNNHVRADGLSRRAHMHRRAQGLSLYTAAERTKMPFMTVYNIEQGHTPRLDNLFKLARGYGVNPIVFTWKSYRPHATIEAFVPESVNELAAVLRMRRQALRLPLRTPAARAGLSWETIRSIEIGNAPDPFPHTIDNYASALGFTSYFLVEHPENPGRMHRGYQSIPTSIRRYRQKHRWSQKELADRTGTNLTNIRSFEQIRSLEQCLQLHHPLIQHVINLANALSVYPIVLVPQVTRI